MKKITRLSIAIFAMAILVIGGIVAIELNNPTHNIAQLWENVLVSILCSLVASLIFALIQSAVDNDIREELKQIRDFCDHNTKNIEKIAEVDSLLQNQNNLYASGVKSIRKKSYFDKQDNFWKNIINNTENNLDLIGHSISSWFKREYKNTFCTKVANMIDADKTVRIILSGNINKKQIKKYINDEDKWDCLNKVEKTICILKNLKVKDIDKFKNLQVYLDECSNVTYLYIKTDKQCLISPYISKENNNNSFLLEMSSGSEYVKTYEDDFEEVKKNCTKIEWSEF